MQAAPAQLTMVCPACPGNGQAQLITLRVDQMEARCPGCGKRYDVVTRQVSASRTRRIDAQRTRYQVVTQETPTRTRPRVFEAQPNVRLRAGSWVTLVYRGARLVGVADQTQALWYPIQALPPRHPAIGRLLRVLTGLCGLLALLQLLRWSPQMNTLLVEHGAAGAAVLIAVLLFAAAPAMLFALQTLRAGEPKRYLPTSTSADWDIE